MRVRGWAVGVGGVVLLAGCAGARGPVALRFAWAPGDHAEVTSVSTEVDPCASIDRPRDVWTRELTVSGAPGAVVVEGLDDRGPVCPDGDCGVAERIDALGSTFRRPFRARIAADGTWAGHVDPEAWDRAVEAAFAEARALVDELPEAEREGARARLRDREAAAKDYPDRYADVLWHQELFSLTGLGPFTPGRSIEVPDRLLGHTSRVEVLTKVPCREGEARRCVVVREVATWHEDIGSSPYDATYAAEWTVEPDTLRIWKVERRFHGELSFGGRTCPEDLGETETWTWALAAGR